MNKPFIGDFPPGQLFGQNFNNYYQSEGLKGHGGIDFPMPNGTEIIAACDGQVIRTYTDARTGEGVNILSDETFNINGVNCRFACIYYHMMDGSLKVKVGDKIKTGQSLGLSNNTGQTTGPHLHFSLFPLIVSANGSRTEAFPNNGYKGAIDPMLYCAWLVEPSDLQKRLNLLPESISALKVFQRNHGLTPDGVIGPKTRQKLMS